MRFRRARSIPTNSFLHRFLLRRRGKRDGRKKIPRADERTISEQERQLLNRCKQHMAQLVAEYAHGIRQTGARLSASVELFKTLLTAFRDETLRYDGRRKELNRNVVITHVSRNSYLGLLVLIAIGEFVLNAQAFEVFQKPMLLTWLMALTLAILIPWVAHACGIWVRQWPKPAWATGLKLAVTTTVTIACLIGANLARQAYLEGETISRGTQSDILEHAFLAINIFVFLGATTLSYFSHDPDYELETLHKRVSTLDRKLDCVDRRIYKWEGMLEELRLRRRAELDVISAITLELVSIYREANRLARNGEEVSAFKEIPKIASPDYGPEPAPDLEEQVGELRRLRYEARSGAAAGDRV